MQKRIKVVYADGREVLAVATPKAQVETERKWGIALDAMTTMEQVYYLAWAALFHKGMEHTDYETFLKSVDEITPVAEDSADKQHNNPTQEAALPDESSRSASQPISP